MRRAGATKLNKLEKHHKKGYAEMSERNKNEIFISERMKHKTKSYAIDK